MSELNQDDSFIQQPRLFPIHWPGLGLLARLARWDFLLFLSLWLAYGLVINSSNLTEFNLQQMGVEAIVERGVFFVDGSPTPQLQPQGDVFEYNGHLYAAKQPGQFMAGALVYFVLHLLGLSYLKQFLLTSALVTWFTAGLVTAIAAVVMFHLARAMASGRSPVWALAVALAFGLATIALSYSGIAHHDAIASGYLVIAFYLVFRLGRQPDRPVARWWAAGAGLFLGLTITTSMLPFFMVLVVGLYFLSLRKWYLLPWLIAGGLVGLGPLLFYDAVNFGSPLALPNIAGNFSDTFFHPALGNLESKLRFYSGFVTMYVPIVWWGLAGLIFLPKEFRREQLVLVGMLAVLSVYVLNIDTNGDCQFGPRYLLPAMPFATLGLVGWSCLSSRPLKVFAAVTALGAGLFAAAVNLSGALYGAMFCDLKRYAFTDYLTRLAHGKFFAFPLAAWLVVPFCACLILVLVWIVTRSKMHSGQASVLSPVPQ